MFGEPGTVTLDAMGLHVVSPSVSEHLRWRVFSSVAVDQDVLVLRLQGTNVVRAWSLETLDAGIDQEWLAHEVARLIAADAVNAGPTT